MLMYTSCGWFFDELSGLETVQVIMYAGRVVQLGERLFNRSIEAPFMARLKEAKSNIPGYEDGAWIYAHWVKPAAVNLDKVGAHYAISSLFEDYEADSRVFAYGVHREDQRISQSGKLRMLLGRARLTSEITQDTDRLSYGALHFGDHNINAGVRRYRDPEHYEHLASAAEAAFSRADLAEVIRLFDRDFEMNTFSLKSLFRDEQRKILSQILDSTVADAEALYRQQYERQAPMMRFLANLGSPMPKAFRTAAEYAINSHLRRELAAEEPDAAQIKRFLDEAKLANVELDATTLEYQFRLTLERLAHRFEEDPLDIEALRRLDSAAALLPLLPFGVNLWTVQNICWDVMRYAVRKNGAGLSDQASEAWLESFQNLAGRISLKIG